MFTLGTWQVQRLFWKENLIATLEQAANTPPSTALPQSDEALLALTYERFIVEGEYLHGYEAHLTPRYYQSDLGYHILTPFRMTDGRIILLNRGWVPTHKKQLDTRAETVVIGPHEQTIMIRSDRDHNRFTPINQPDQNIWFWRDIAAIETHTGLDLLPINADVIAENP